MGVILTAFTVGQLDTDIMIPGTMALGIRAGAIMIRSIRTGTHGMVTAITRRLIIIMPMDMGMDMVTGTDMDIQDMAIMAGTPA